LIWVGIDGIDGTGGEDLNSDGIIMLRLGTSTIGDIDNLQGFIITMMGKPIQLRERDQSIVLVYIIQPIIKWVCFSL
jgi:hypothetical protein